MRSTSGSWGPLPTSARILQRGRFLSWLFAIMLLKLYRWTFKCQQIWVEVAYFIPPPSAVKQINPRLQKLSQKDCMFLMQLCHTMLIVVERFIRITVNIKSGWKILIAANTVFSEWMMLSGLDRMQCGITWVCTSSLCALRTWKELFGRSTNMSFTISALRISDSKGRLSPTCLCTRCNTTATYRLCIFD